MTRVGEMLSAQPYVSTLPRLPRTPCAASMKCPVRATGIVWVFVCFMVLLLMIIPSFMYKKIFCCWHVVHEPACRYNKSLPVVPHCSVPRTRSCRRPAITPGMVALSRLPTLGELQTLPAKTPHRRRAASWHAPPRYERGLRRAESDVARSEGAEQRPGHLRLLSLLHEQDTMQSPCVQEGSACARAILRSSRQEDQELSRVEWTSPVSTGPMDRSSPLHGTAHQTSHAAELGSRARGSPEEGPGEMLCNSWRRTAAGWCKATGLASRQVWIPLARAPGVPRRARAIYSLDAVQSI
jgi:hypothetical protein